MPTSWRRIETRQKRPTTEALRQRARAILEDFGRIGVDSIRRNVWNYGRFVYAGRYPKPSRSKSEEAWTYRIEAWGNTPEALIFSNPVVNKYGTNYAKYVHLAGRPKSERLMEAVGDHVFREIGPALARAVAEAYVDEASRAGTTTSITTITG